MTYNIIIRKTWKFLQLSEGTYSIVCKDIGFIHLFIYKGPDTRKKNNIELINNKNIKNRTKIVQIKENIKHNDICA